MPIEDSGQPNLARSALTEFGVASVYRSDISLDPISRATLMSSPTTNARTQLIAGIELFLAIQRHRSISKAAWALGITQSAASKQLKALETLAGAPLFIRTTRSLKLSDTGRALLQGSRDLVQNTDKLLEILQESSGRPSVLKVASPPLFCQQHMVPHLKAFRAAHPNIELRLMFSYEPVDLVRDDIDLMVFIGHLPDRRLVASRIAQQQRVLCASPSFLALRGPVQTPEDLCRLPCLTHTQVTANGIWYHLSGKTVEKLRVAGPLASNSTDALVKAAVQGWGITLMPSWAVHAELQAGTLVRLLEQHQFDIEHEQQPRHISFLWLPQLSQSRQLQSFVQFFSDIFGQPPYWDH